MNDLFSYDNYIFDLYGTLIDIRTDEWDIKTWKRWHKVLKQKKIKHPRLRKFRKEFFEKDREYRSRPTPYDYPEIEVLEVYDELFTKYGNAPIDRDELFEISYAFRVASRDYMKLFDGVKEFIDKLHSLGKKVYILSNAQKSYTLYEIQAMGLDKLVDDFIISSDYGCMKPDKAFYSALIEKHGMDREKTIMFGDSKENDYEGAIKSGISGVWLNGENSSDKFYLNNI